MKKKILITLLSLFSLTLFAQTVEEKAEQQNYKHDNGTFFGIMDGNKFHVFSYTDEMHHFGYINFYGAPTSPEITEGLEEEAAKHMSESYFFMHKNDKYHLYYKDYMGEIKFLTAGKIIREPKVATSLSGALTKDTEIKEEPQPESEPESEEASDDEDDDSGGGGFPWWTLLLVFFLLGGFKD